MNDSLHQFYLDVPRMNIFLNGVETNDPDVILKYSKEKLPNHVDMIVFMLTQTFLAKFYIEEHSKRIINEEYLLDNGNYTVNIVDDNIVLQNSQVNDILYICI